MKSFIQPLPYLLILFSIVINTSCLGQDAYKKGKIFFKNGKVAEANILDMDWKNNPTSINYKLLSSEERLTSEVEDLLMFEIPGQVKYIAAQVNIDRSGMIKEKASDQREPVYSAERVFLKVILEGEASLLQYSDKNLNRFFYQVGEGEIEPLVFKFYYQDPFTIVENVTFKQQLFNRFNCNNMAVEIFEKLSYTEKSLKGFFANYNECSGFSDFSTFKRKSFRQVLMVHLKAGVQSGSLSISRPSTFIGGEEIDFNSSSSPVFGVEAEYFLPFRNNKWAVISEFTYQSFEDSQVQRVSPSRTSQTEVNFSSLETSLGIRQFIYATPKSSFFFNASFNVDLQFGDNFITRESFDDLIINFAPNFSVGAGYKYGKRMRVELNYETGQDVLTSYVSWASSYRTLSLQVGYNIYDYSK